MELRYAVKTFPSSKKKDFSSFILGGDIGGTNTTLCVAGIHHKTPYVLFSLLFKSQQLPSLVPAVKETITYAKKHYNITIRTAGIGAAGVVSPSADGVRLTNVPWNIRSSDLIKKTGLSSVYLINDFQAVGYGINLLNPHNKKDLLCVKKGKKTKQTYPIKAVLGAGTGLGKSILVYDTTFQAYHPLPSEGGHGDLPLYSEDEMRLAEFIKKQRRNPQPVRYEDVLSGYGIETMYHYLKSKQSTTKLKSRITVPAAVISQYRKKDAIAKETFQYFTRFYGRCAKNFVLDTLATGGLYIAGGIAAKNIDLFKTRTFLDEFTHAYHREDVLHHVPIYVVVNYDVSLYGACFAAVHQLQQP